MEAEAESTGRFGGAWLELVRKEPEQVLPGTSQSCADWPQGASRLVTIKPETLACIVTAHARQELKQPEKHR